MGWFSSTPALPELPAFGPLPPAEAATYFGKHLKAHDHLFPSESPVAWEAVRGWDVNEEPPSLEGPAPIRIAVVTDRLLHFCPPKKKLECMFDFLLHRIEGVEFDANARPSDAPPGVGLLSIYTP